MLVIDEADKAPVNVTCVLKTLVENGEMILGDGRRVVPGTDCKVFYIKIWNTCLLSNKVLAKRWF